MVWTSSLFDFCYPAAFGRIDHLALVSVTPSVWVPCCRSQSSVLLLVSLCAILLLYICCRWHGLYSGFHCPYNIDRIFSLSFRTSVFFLKIPQNRQGGQGIEGSLNPPPLFHPCHDRWLFPCCGSRIVHAALRSFCFSPSCSPLTMQAKGKNVPMSVLGANILLAQITTMVRKHYVEKSTVTHCVLGSLPALPLVHHQSLCICHGY